MSAVNTLRLQPDAQGAARAGEILHAGGVVAIPTETVYGLAASALDENAVARVFAAKGRPSDNPLIVHISDLSQLSQLWESVPERALTLARAFWPGPLTMVLSKTPAVPACVSAGLSTVGVRMPAHPLALDVIRRAGVPLAAPSANASGRPSPTTAADVLQDMDGRIDAVLDGGPCAVGVESTVVDLTGEHPRILRPGAVTLEMIEEALGVTEVDEAVIRPLGSGERPRAPGMKYRHYAPKAPVTVFDGAPSRTAAHIAGLLQPGDGVLCFDDCKEWFSDIPNVLCYGPSWNIGEQGRRLFSALRAFDELPCTRILAQGCRPWGEGAAVRNRLHKSAGFNVVPLGLPVLGVTGRSGCGKSLLTRLAVEMGFDAIDADAVYAELLQNSADMRGALAARFPDEAGPDGIDRRALARRVFGDEAARQDLNAITHPFVLREIDARIAQAGTKGARAIVLDVPLLFESGLDRACTATCAVLSSEELSVGRIVERDGISPEQARARLRAQPGDDYYFSRCDVVLINDGLREDFLKKARFCLQKYGR